MRGACKNVEPEIESLNLRLQCLRKNIVGLAGYYTVGVSITWGIAVIDVAMKMKNKKFYL